MLCEMQSVLSWIWTCVAMSISYDDNHYTTGTSIINLLLLLRLSFICGYWCLCLVWCGNIYCFLEASYSTIKLLYYFHSIPQTLVYLPLFLCLISYAHHVLHVFLGWFVRWEVSYRTVAVWWGATSMICSKQYVAVCSIHIALIPLGKVWIQLFSLRL